MDAREAFGDHSFTAKKSRGHGGVLAAGALAVVFIADGDPGSAVLFILARGGGGCRLLAIFQPIFRAVVCWPKAGSASVLQ